MTKLFLFEGQTKTRRSGFDQWLLASTPNLLRVSDSNCMLSMLITLQLIGPSKLLKKWLTMLNSMQLTPTPSTVISDNIRRDSWHMLRIVYLRASTLLRTNILSCQLAQGQLGLLKKPSASLKFGSKIHNINGKTQ